MNIPKQALELIQIIETNNFEAYIVGGFVRDNLLIHESNDIDMASNATPEELKKLLNNYKIIETGIDHGTITVIIDTMSIELTTYRIDGAYKDQRHPEKVEFTKTLKEDMARRDFTINALAYNPKTGLIDYYDGKKDIQSKIIKTVGNADERFKEDGLRILRALRFAAQLGFRIEKQTEKALFDNKDILKQISPERKLSELKKLLLGNNIKEIIFKYSLILDMIIPNLNLMKDLPQRCPYHIYDVLNHTAISVENIEPIFHLRLAMLLHDIGKIQTHTTDEKGIDHFYGHGKLSYYAAKEITENLKLDKDTAFKVITLVKYHDLPMENTNIWIKKWLNRLGEELFFDLIKVKKADCLAQAPSTQGRIIEIEKIEHSGKQIILKGECFSLKSLAISGNDLIALGIKPSPEIGNILNQLLNQVINDELPNEKQVLLKHIRP